jgi:hypothetical protein
MAIAAVVKMNGCARRRNRRKAFAVWPSKLKAAAARKWEENRHGGEMKANAIIGENSETTDNENGAHQRWRRWQRRMTIVASLAITQKRQRSGMA